MIEWNAGVQPGDPAAHPGFRRPIRAAILATHPIQYQAPLWRALACFPELEVHVYFGADMSVRGYRDAEFGVSVRWDVPLVEGYTHTFLARNDGVQDITLWSPGAAGLGRELERFRPDVALLNAYAGRFWLGGIVRLAERRIPMVIRHEASDDALRRSPIKSFIRDRLLRLLYRRFDGFGAIGTQARRHLQRLGVPEGRIVFTPYCVDSALMATQIEGWGPKRNALRREMGIGAEDCVFAFSGKLIPKKAPMMLVDALARLGPADHRRMHAVFVGDGELRGAVEAAGRRLPGCRCHFSGFVNQSQIGRYYALADCLVLPSARGAGETWGLVVNEALHFGLPAIVSDGVGCQPDLVPDAATGRVFPAGDVDALARALREIAGELPAARDAYARNARARIAGFTMEAAARGLRTLLVAGAGAAPRVLL